MRAHAVVIVHGQPYSIYGCSPAGFGAGADCAPAVGALETTPIGKVVSAKGSVTVEHTQAVVLQAADARDRCGQGRRFRLPG